MYVWPDPSQKHTELKALQFNSTTQTARTAGPMPPPPLVAAAATTPTVAPPTPSTPRGNESPEEQSGFGQTVRSNAAASCPGFEEGADLSLQGNIPAPALGQALREAAPCGPPVKSGQAQIKDKAAVILSKATPQPNPIAEALGLGACMVVEPTDNSRTNNRPFEKLTAALGHRARSGHNVPSYHITWVAENGAPPPMAGGGTATDATRSGVWHLHMGCGRQMLPTGGAMGVQGGGAISYWTMGQRTGIW